MKSLTLHLAVALCMLPFALLAQAPELISFQGNLTNLGGDPINSTESIVFTMYDGSSPIWTETQPTVQIVNGVFNVLLGSVNPLSSIWFSRQLKLGIKVGTDPEISPRTDLASAPYSLGMRGIHTILATDEIQDGLGYNIVGGWGNDAYGGIGIVIAGGGGILFNSPVGNEAEGHWATVSGGASNYSYAWGSVGGGEGNRAGAFGSVGGGSANKALGDYATVSGGSANEAPGDFAAIPGGYLNKARANYSFAGGFNARTGVIHSGSFVWSDRSKTALADSFATTNENQFIIRAAGGVGIGTNAPVGELTVSAGDAGDTDVYIIADPDNNLESDNPMIRMRQDGGQTGVNIGFNEVGYGSNVFGIARHSAGLSYNNTFLIEMSSGDIGIGTSSLTNRVRVAESIDASGTSAENYVSWIENTSTGTGPDVLALSVGTTSPGSGANFLGFFADGTLIGQVDGNGTSVVYNTSGADYAELVPRRGGVGRIEVGSVVGVREGYVSLETSGVQRVMVVTDRPAVLGNMRPGEEEAEGFEPIAFVGQVPVNVRGVVEAGDYIVVSGLNDGFGRAVSPEDLRVADLDKVAGVAWEASSDPGAKKVMIEVGLDRAAAAAHAFARMIDVLEQNVVSERQRRTELEERVAKLERLTGS